MLPIAESNGLSASPESIVLISAALAFLTGALILKWPQVVYYYVAANLMIAGILILTFGGNSTMAIIGIGASLLILLFPKLIPYLFASYLLSVSVLLIVSSGWNPLSVFPGVMGILLFCLPNLISYLIASYFLLTGAYLLIQQWS